jgi:UDP-N-acetylmuramate dehydrogenase
MNIEQMVPLAPLTTFNIGGPALYFTNVETPEELEEAVTFAKAKGLPKLILGGGSNLLVNDKGFEGLVIQLTSQGIEIEEEVIVAQAGESWDKLVQTAVKHELWGVENLSAIPGSVGGAVVQNIGAYGAALSDVLLWAEVLDTDSGEVRKYTNLECKFDYRDSIFKHNPNLVVIRTACKLSRTPKPNTSYKDLAARFSESSVDIAAIRQAVIEIRKGKFPDLTTEGSAGSFFKNPIVDAAGAEVLKQRYPNLPVFTMPETKGVKVPLAWFLDDRNGVLALEVKAVGGARLYEKQPLVIAAARGCKSEDVVALAEIVKKEIKEKINLEIEEEVKII